MPLTPEDKQKVTDAFAALEQWVIDRAAVDALERRAKQAVKDVEPTLKEILPVNQRVRIPGTRFKVLSDGVNVQVKQDTPELSLEDLS